MSGGHWDYLSTQIEDRIGVPLDDVWRLLAAIEHELDWGICGDICYECAKVRTINALESYFDTEAISVENALRILRSSVPACRKCIEREAQQKTPRHEPPREAFAIQFTYGGKLYRGTASADGEQEEVSQ